MAGSKRNKGTVLNVCVGYGGRGEILNGVKGVVRDVIGGRLSEEEAEGMTEDEFGGETESRAEYFSYAIILLKTPTPFLTPG